ncbi:Sigma-70 region 2 [Prevotella sp. DNF00663]|uniref:RNA polymerase sigma factor n=1 Tax=Prevotella sp. DNF00663 TaxID=1384078 RepID=UPI00079937B7|nr:RNA polymerase sigma factor [Prevotella sp. DNF00663]KXB85164.1 Sigma-70 region 2 [Prevotella sp. DNF00663]
MSVQVDMWQSQLADPAQRRETFSKAVHQYSEPLYWKIRRIVLTHEDANDVLQNTFIKAWNNLDKFKSNSKFTTWLFRIAINESLDFVRKQKVRASISQDGDTAVVDTLLADEYFDGDKTQALLQESIAQLPEVQRAVFTLRYYDEMKYSEMSEVLRTSEGALKASYHLAVKKITEYLRDKD